MKPEKGEIWLVEFEPHVGSEISKIRPAMVLSIPSLKFLTTRIVVPLRNHKEFHEGCFYYITVLPNKLNGLIKKSTIDCPQVKSFDIQRFKKRLGKISNEIHEEIIDTVSICIGGINK